MEQRPALDNDDKRAPGDGAITMSGQNNGVPISIEQFAQTILDEALREALEAHLLGEQTADELVRAALACGHFQ